ncbi:MAG: precorrin-6y C5,15-methyltransferase (decarboxylating) subunit CbiE [Desulfobacca sp.]|uniref:precorrin-6y C5,15-methyltransferase (decarboxylating) subunit CbiE n=1 Tax=Desulfobacca sp. TaxID=2067990 RepID=UPI00404A662A
MVPVHVIGLGMSPADLTAAHLKIIQGAQVLAGGRRHLDYFPDHPGDKIVIGRDLPQVLAAIRQAAACQQVVVLASGDPNFFGIGPQLTAFLGPENVIIHPNITAVQSACALLRLSWDDAVVVSLHGRGPEALTAVLGRADKIIVYTAGAETPHQIAKLLTAPGCPAYRLAVVENLGQAGEQAIWLTPAEVASRTFAPLNLVVLLKDSTSPPQPLHLGLAEEALEHEAGLITKTEIRAVVLAKLRLLPGLVLWDVGAGCGSVGLEASLLLPGGRVLAIEQHPTRVQQIRANQQRFGVGNLTVIDGEAPACLDALPAPDRVFVGGGGRHLMAILAAVLPRLRAGGRLVLTAALLASLQAASDYLQAAGWQVEVCQLQVSRSRPLAGSLYLQALNPVWIITATPPGAAT